MAHGDLKHLNEDGQSSEELSATNRAFMEQHENQIQKHQMEMERLALDKKALNQKIKAMEKKLLKGEKKGGMIAVASDKEQRLQKNQARLSRRQSLFIKIPF